MKFFVRLINLLLNNFSLHCWKAYEDYFNITALIIYIYKITLQGQPHMHDAMGWSKLLICIKLNSIQKCCYKKFGYLTSSYHFYSCIHNKFVLTVTLFCSYLLGISIYFNFGSIIYSDGKLLTNYNFKIMKF